VQDEEEKHLWKGGGTVPAWGLHETVCTTLSSTACIAVMQTVVLEAGEGEVICPMRRASESFL